MTHIHIHLHGPRGRTRDAGTKHDPKNGQFASGSGGGATPSKSPGPAPTAAEKAHFAGKKPPAPKGPPGYRGIGPDGEIAPTQHKSEAEAHENVHLRRQDLETGGFKHEKSVPNPLGNGNNHHFSHANGSRAVISHEHPHLADGPAGRHSVSTHVNRMNQGKKEDDSDKAHKRIKALGAKPINANHSAPEPAYARAEAEKFAAEMRAAAAKKSP